MVTSAPADRPRTAADVILAAEAALAAARARRADPTWTSDVDDPLPAGRPATAAMAATDEGPAAGPGPVPVPPTARSSRPRRLGWVRTFVKLVLTVVVLIAVLAGLPALAMLLLD
jgi:hypothetical protein